MNDQIAELKEHVNTIAADLKADIKNLNHILTGNGTPENGYVYRTARAEHDIKNVKLVIQDVPELRTKTESLQTQMKEHTEARKWWFRSIIGAAIVSVTASVVAAWKGVP